MEKHRGQQAPPLPREGQRTVISAQLNSRDRQTSCQIPHPSRARGQTRQYKPRSAHTSSPVSQGRSCSIPLRIALACEVALLWEGGISGHALAGAFGALNGSGSCDQSAAAEHGFKSLSAGFAGKHKSLHPEKIGKAIYAAEYMYGGTKGQAPLKECRRRGDNFHFLNNTRYLDWLSHSVPRRRAAACFRVSQNKRLNVSNRCGDCGGSAHGDGAIYRRVQRYFGD